MAQLVDVHGQAISSKPPREQQSARVGWLRQEFAEHPSRGLTPATLAQVLDEAEQGYLMSQADLFEDMEEKDAHIYTEMSKRKRALMGLDWDIVPPPNPNALEKKAAERVKEQLSDISNLPDVIFDMADAIGKGYSCLEVGWSLVEKQWVPTEIEQRPARWFMVPYDRRNDLRLRDNTAFGAELQPFGWIVHVHRARSGYITRAGLHRTLAWPYLFKNYAVRDLAEFLEIYGLPLRLGTYPPGASDDEKVSLLSAVVNIGHNASGIIPEGMAIDFQEAAKGDNKPFEAMIGWCERSESKAIIGATLTTEVSSSGGNRALGKVHHEVMWDIIISDARQVEGTLTRDLCFPMAAFNSAGITSRARAPRFKFDTVEGEDLQTYSDAIPALVDIGMPVPVRWAMGMLRIPEPRDNEPVLKRVSGAPKGSTADQPGQTAALKAEAGAGADAIDNQVDQLDDDLMSPLGDWINKVKQLVDTAGSLEDVRDGLMRLYPEMTIDQYAKAMAEALTAAKLSGRYDVLSDASGRG